MDKAGNIRTENITDRDSVAAMLHEAADQTGGFAHVRGPISDDEVNRLTDELGIEGGREAIAGLRKMAVDNNIPMAVAVKYTRRLLKQSAEEAVTLMNKARVSKSIEDITALGEARNRILMIAETVSGITDEWGRTGRAFRDISKEEMHDVNSLVQLFQGTTPEEMIEMAEVGSSLKEVGQINQFMQDSTKPTFGEMIVEYRTNTLVSGPVTHARYAEGNHLTSLFEPLVLIPAEAGIDVVRNAIRGLMGKERAEDTVHIIRALGQFYGMGQGHVDGLRAGIQAWKDERAPVLPGESMSQGWNYPKSIGSEAVKGTRFEKAGPLLDKAGPIIRAPGRAVNAIHSFYSQLLYEQKITGLAFDKAWNEGHRGEAFSNRVADLRAKPSKEMMITAGDKDPASVLAGEQARIEGLIPDTEQFKQRVEELKTAPTPEMSASLKQIQMWKQSSGEARQDVYMDESKAGTISGDLNRFINKHPAIKCMIPFMKIGNKVESRAFIQGTPLALANKTMRDDIFYRNGGYAGTRALAKIAAGTAVAGTVIQLMSEGSMTGDGPEDPKLRDTWLKTHQPNSIQIGGMWFSYNRLGYLGAQMRFVANMYETHKYWNKADGENLAATFFEGLSKSVLNDSWMYGLKSMLDAVYHPHEYMQNFVQDFTTSWMPMSVGSAQIARQIDPYQRRVRSVGESAEAKIPFASEGLYPKRDSFGEPISQHGIGSALAGVPSDPYKNDITVARLLALGIGIGRLEPQINGIKLDENQYDQFSMIAGRKTKLLLDATIGQPGFAQQDPRDQINAITQIIREARDDARGVMMTNFPEIPQKAAAKKAGQ